MWIWETLVGTFGWVGPTHDEKVENQKELPHMLGSKRWFGNVVTNLYTRVRRWLPTGKRSLEVVCVTHLPKGFIQEAMHIIDNDCSIQVPSSTLQHGWEEDLCC